MNVTTLPVGATGQFLEGVAVSTGVRESVILTSPSDANGFAEVVSSQPINFYGLPVWVQGTPSFSTSGNITIQGTSSVNVLNTLTANVTNVPLVTVQGTSSVNVISSVPHAISGTVSTQIVSSIPFFVAQSSSPWTMNGGLAVTNSPNVNVTNVPAVNITSSIPFFVAQSSGPWTVSPTGTTMVNIVSTVTQGANITSSIPFFVAQSSAPWAVNGAVAVTNSPNVNVTNVPAVNITSSIPLIVSQSSGIWNVQGTTSPNIVSSIPFFVAQSSAPWSIVETVSTAGGMNVTTIALLATLNTTVVKATPGQVYGILGVNTGTSNIFVRMINASTAATVIASTGVALVNFGMLVSTSPYNNYDAGVPFNSGISLITQQQPYTASTSLAPSASTATITIFYK